MDTLTHSRPLIILLLEDDDDDYKLAMASLERDKLLNEVYRVRDGQEGLDYLEHKPVGEADAPGDTKIPFAQAPMPDIIVSDLRMPHLDGREFIARAKQDPRWRRIPIVVLTTSNDERDVTEAYELGAASYVVKPLSLSEMGRVVRDIRDFYWTVVRLPGLG